MAATVAPLKALNGEGADGTLIQPIRKVPVTDGGDEGPFASWQYEQAVKMAGVTGGGAREWHADVGTVTMDQIKASQKATKPKFFIDLVDDIAACEAEFAALTKALDAACGNDSPPTSTIRRTLEAVAAIARSWERTPSLPPRRAKVLQHLRAKVSQRVDRDRELPPAQSARGKTRSRLWRAWRIISATASRIRRYPIPLTNWFAAVVCRCRSC